MMELNIQLKTEKSKKDKNIVSQETSGFQTIILILWESQTAAVELVMQLWQIFILKVGFIAVSRHVHGSAQIIF